MNSRWDDARAPHGRHEDLALARDGGKVLGARVAHGHGGVRVGQQHRHGLADDVAAADDDRALARHLDVLPLQELHHARGSTRLRTGPLLDELPDALRVEAVDVLRRVDAVEELRRVEVVGQRELEQDSIDVVALVELVELRSEPFLRRLGGEDHGLGEQPRLRAGLDLAVHVEPRRGVVTDENRREAGRHALGDERLRVLLDLVADLLRDALAVQSCCRHQFLLIQSRSRKRVV